MESIKRKLLSAALYSVVIMVMIVSAFSMTSTFADAGPLEPVAINAKVETWSEQTWRDKWFGNGFWQTRTLYTINPKAQTKARVYENRILLLSNTNYTSEKQSASYSYSETRGYTFNSEVSAKIKYFNAALGLSLSKATTKAYTANVNVPGNTTVNVYGSDIRILQQYSVYKKQPQRASFKGWINNGKATQSEPLVKQYSGKHIEWSYN